MRKILLLLFILAMPFTVLAEEEVKKDVLNCSAFEAEIRKEIRKANTCWKDEDCQTEDYGCPWQLGICHKYLTEWIY